MQEIGNSVNGKRRRHSRSRAREIDNGGPKMFMGEAGRRRWAGSDDDDYVSGSRADRLTSESDNIIHYIR